MNNFIIATIKPWNISNFHKYQRGGWFLVTENRLLQGTIKTLNPRAIFFPHWNHIVPKEIYKNYECVIFHATDLPKGKGKEPFQYLIENGYESTTLTVFRCVNEIDSGPVYAKIPLSLSGSVEECYKRCSYLIFDQIVEMTTHINKGRLYTPKIQIGESSNCSNPTNEILLDAIDNLDEIYHKIRAWDSESYPKAYFDVDEFTFEFSNSVRRHNCVEAHVKISMKEE